MANSYTVNEQSVFGTYRVQIGTFTATDGAAGGAVDTGLDRVVFASTQTPNGVTHATGAIALLTATSGSAHKMFVIGV